MKSKGLPKYTEKSITEPALFLEEVKQARINGYATDYEEYISGVRAVPRLLMA
jgi:DNA-binding IclR family transcriptional regulator